MIYWHVAKHSTCIYSQLKSCSSSEVASMIEGVLKHCTSMEVIFYGKGGEIPTNRMEDQEVAVLSLHLLQNCLVYINTLMIQSVLSEKKWMDIMIPEDLRALSPLIYSHVNPYGIFNLDMMERIPIEERSGTTPIKKTEPPKYKRSCLSSIQYFS